MADDVDHGLLAHRAATEHLQACMEAFDAESSGEDDVEWPELLAAPFDGCEDCMVREVLTAAWPHVLAAAREELAAGANAGPLTQ